MNAYSLHLLDPQQTSCPSRCFLGGLAGGRGETQVLLEALTQQELRSQQPFLSEEWVWGRHRR